jgi:hypothetical protein
MKKKLFSLCFLLVFSFISCKKGNDQDCDNVTFTKISFATGCTPVIVDHTTTDMLLVIRSIGELKASLSFENSIGIASCGIDHPIFKTDFSKSSIIIIKKQVQGIEPALIKQSLIRNCKDNSFTYNAEIKNGGYTAIGNYIGAIIIDKLPKNIKVDFNVRVLKE